MAMAAKEKPASKHSSIRELIESQKQLKQDAADLAREVDDCQLMLSEATQNHIERALKEAMILKALVERMPPAMVAGLCRMAANDSDLFFESDQVYPDVKVAEVTAIALLQGYRLVGYEWGILQGKFYPKAAGLRRKILEVPGVTNLEIQLAIPEITQSGRGAIVAAKVAWVKDGAKHHREWVKTEQDDFRIAVKVNQGQGPDAILGKARRKAFAQVFEIVSGQTVDDPDETTEPTTELFEKGHKDANHV